MVEAVVFPDVEAELVEWLGGQLADRNDTAVVATKVPNPRPDRGVRLSRIGGPQLNATEDEPRIAIECYDTDETAAADLARVVRALVRTAAPGWLGTAWCDAVRDLGMLSRPDLDAELPRYVITVEMRILGTAL